MSGSSDIETAMLLGQFKAQIESLTKALEAQTQKSDARGARIYGELETIRSEQADMRRDMTGMKNSFDKADKTIAEVNRWRERLIGMTILIGFVCSVFGGAMVIFWRWISAKIGV